jgi:hypothetical protein
MCWVLEAVAGTQLSMSEVLFGLMMDHRCLIGTLLPTIAGTTRRRSRVCDKHDALACLLLRLVYEYLEAMQFSACTPLQMRVDS